jgi:hypothetical protein
MRPAFGQVASLFSLPTWFDTVNIPEYLEGSRDDLRDKKPPTPRG